MRTILRALSVCATLLAVGLPARGQAFSRQPFPGTAPAGDPDSLQVQVLQSPDSTPARRLLAATTLGRYGTSLAFPALAQCAAFDPDREVRIASGDAIARIRQREQANWIKPLPPNRPDYYERLVRGWYRLYLHRDADPGGLKTWVDALRQGGRPEEVKASLLGSDEYYRKHGSTPGRWITNLYTDVLGRVPTAPEIQKWARVLQQQRQREKVALEFLEASKAELAAREVPGP